MAGLHFDKAKSSGRKRIIEAALRLLQDHPFDEVTIDEIVKAADLSRPAFYYHFAKGKEELREELVRRGSIAVEPAPDTRQEVLQAALRIFARSGFPAATLDDIADEAGISRSTLCWHFRSKEDLLRAIIDNQKQYSAVHTTIEKIEQELQSSHQLDDEKILRCIAGGFYDAFTTQGDITRLSVLLIYTHPEAAGMLAEKIIRGRKGIVEYIEQRQKEGVFRKEIDASLFIQFIATSFAMRAIGRELYDLMPFGHLSREETINQLVSLLLYGISERKIPQ